MIELATITDCPICNGTGKDSSSRKKCKPCNKGKIMGMPLSISDLVKLIDKERLNIKLSKEAE